MPRKMTLPSDLDARLAGFDKAIAASCPEVLFAYLFGSAATGTMTRHSDVDPAVFVAPEADAHAAQLAVARLAARHLGTDAIDVVLEGRIGAHLEGERSMERQGLPLAACQRSHAGILSTSRPCRP